MFTMDTLHRCVSGRIQSFQLNLGGEGRRNRLFGKTKFNSSKAFAKGSSKYRGLSAVLLMAAAVRRPVGSVPAFAIGPACMAQPGTALRSGAAPQLCIFPRQVLHSKPCNCLRLIFHPSPKPTGCFSFTPACPLQPIGNCMHWLQCFASSMPACCKM